MSSVLQNTTLVAFMQDNEIEFLEVIHEQEPMEESCPNFLSFVMQLQNKSLEQNALENWFSFVFIMSRIYFFEMQAGKYFEHF